MRQRKLRAEILLEIALSESLILKSQSGAVCTLTLNPHDDQEGVAAFGAKRAPVFTDR